MNCPACSNSLSSNAKFCPKCGWANRPVESRLSVSDEQVQPPLEENAPATKVCAECGASSKLTAKFCAKCSHAFQQEPSVHQTADVTQPHSSQDIPLPARSVVTRAEELVPEPEAVDVGLSLKAPQEALSVQCEGSSQSAPSADVAVAAATQHVTEAEILDVPELDASAQAVDEVLSQQGPAEPAQDRPVVVQSDVALHSQEVGDAVGTDALAVQSAKPLWQKLLLGFVILLLILAVGTWYVMKDSGSVVLKEEAGNSVVTDKSPQVDKDLQNNDAAHGSLEKQGADNQSPNNAGASQSQENTLKEAVATETPPAQVVKPANQLETKPAAKPSAKGGENKEKPSAARSAIY